jgi:hypothetical protein
MILNIQSYNNGGTVYNAMAEDGNIIGFTLTHEFNEAARATITLRDPTGAVMQTYNDDANDVYIGAGRVELESPDTTDIFHGRVLKAVADTRERTVTLHCEDWLNQLKDEKIKYDMREDLDGAGLREYYVAADYDNADAQGILLARNTAGAKYIYFKGLTFANDQWNSYYLIFLHSMAGDINVKTGPYALTCDASTVNAFTNDIGDVWTEDTDRHTASDVGGTWSNIWSFKVWTPDSSSWYVSCSGARINVIIGLGSDVNVQLYNGATYDELDNNIGTAGTAIIKKTFVVPDNLLSGMFDANGEAKVKFEDADDGAMYTYFVELECDFVTTGYSTATPITDTVASGTKLRTDTDFSADATKVWQGLPICIAQPIYKHIDSAETPGGLITDGDDMATIVCAGTVEHTSGISTRQFIDMSRFEILQQLAEQDKANFWITLGGKTLTWKSTWNDGAPTAMTDATVIAWSSNFDWDTVYNEYHVIGARIGDEQLQVYTEDLTVDPGDDSQAKYLANRTKVLRATGLVSEYDCEQTGSNLVERDEDVQQILGCALVGLDSTYRLGTEVSITSTYLNLAAAKYIVSGWSYDSRAHETRLRLHPRISAVGLQPDKSKVFQKAIDRTERLQSDAYIPAPATNTVVND